MISTITDDFEAMPSASLPVLLHESFVSKLLAKIRKEVYNATSKCFEVLVDVSVCQNSAYKKLALLLEENDSSLGEVKSYKMQKKQLD